MASVGTVQRAPEIVIVNDGKPVENVGASSRGALIAKIAVPAVLTLAVGIGIGKISKGANIYNEGLKDTRSILGDDKAPSTVKNVKRALSDLDSVLDELNTKNGLKPDAAADKKLSEIAAKLDVKTSAVFRTAAAVEPEINGLIMSFYAGAAEVKSMIDTHLKAAKSDVLALNNGKAAADAAAARRVMKSSAIDLVVLDIMMPGEDGLSLCRSIRETSQIPVIVLTAKGEEVDRIIGLEMGADDYIAKPFSPRELIARIAAVLRRTQALPPRQKPPSAARIRFGDWILDTGQRELIGAEGVAMPLSSGEFRLLTTLLERPKIALTRNQLLDLTKGRDAELFDRSIDNHVSRLRKKIEPDPKNPRYIKTVWGGGYIFALEPETE